MTSCVDDTPVDSCLNRPGFGGGSNLWEDGAMRKSVKFSCKVRERAVYMAFEHSGEYE